MSEAVRLEPHRDPAREAHPPSGPGPAGAPRRRAGRRADAAALGFFVLVAFVFAIPRWPSAWTSEIPGDSGDALLNLWILEWAGRHAASGWRDLWDTTIFWPNPNTLAYSESMLPVALVHRALAAVTGSGVLAFNLLHLAAWTLAGWATYLLARRLGVAGPGAVVAGLVYAVACPRLAHVAHFQLGFGSLLPLALLALVWFLDRPGPARGAGLGAVAAVCALSTSYYGVMLAVGLAIAVPVFVLARARAGRLRPVVTGLAAAGLVGAALVLPVANQYRVLQQDPHFRRHAEPALAAHLADFLRVTPEHVLLAGVPPFESRSRPESATVENRLYPGLPALALGVVGLAVVVAAARRGEPGARRLLVLAVPGVVLTVLAFGDRLEVAGHSLWMPYAALRDVPGFSGVRATARLVAYGVLALGLLAGAGLGWLLARLPARPVRALAAGAAVVAVGAESFMTVGFVRVPGDDAHRAVNEALAGREPGAVVELPVGSPSDGWVWAFVEMPRQYLSLADGHPRVGGYSGYAPPGFDELAATLETFPAPASLRALDALRVRYVVLRTDPPGDLDATQAEHVGADGVGAYPEARARAMVDALPDDRVARAERVGAAWLVELAR